MVAGLRAFIHLDGPVAAPVGVGQLLVQRAGELVAPDLEQELLQAFDARLVAGLDGAHQPQVEDFDVAAFGQAERFVHGSHLVGVKPVAELEQEVPPLAYGPFVHRNFGQFDLAVQPLAAPFVDLVERVRGRQHRVVGHARLEDPFAHLFHVHRIRVARQQVFLQVSDEVLGVDRLEREMIEVLPQEFIEGLAPETVFQPHQEQPALVVGHAVEGLLRVLVGQVAGQDLRGRIELFELFVQAHPVQRRLHLGALGRVQGLDDTAFEIGGEALVQPQVLPGGVGHQVARPGVGQFVGDQRGQ